MYLPAVLTGGAPAGLPDQLALVSMMAILAPYVCHKYAWNSASKAV